MIPDTFGLTLRFGSLLNSGVAATGYQLSRNRTVGHAYWIRAGVVIPPPSITTAAVAQSILPASPKSSPSPVVPPMGEVFLSGRPPLEITLLQLVIRVQYRARLRNIAGRFESTFSPATNSTSSVTRTSTEKSE